MWFWLAPLALAGNVYVNEVDVSALRNTTLTDVTVRFDAEGNVHITAPQYEIQVVTADSAPTAAPSPTPKPTTGPAPAPAGAGLEAGRWWLVTEDDGSRGHSVEVSINGTPALTVRSGEEQRIEDLGPWLKPGTNRITMRSMSAAAGGGPLYLYIGGGTNESGTLVMETPTVQFGLGPTRDGPFEREYTLAVPR